MRNAVLANTSSGVETVSALDHDALDNLGRWLCQEKDYHDKHDAFHRNGHIGCEDEAFRQFEEEQKDNGGYCNVCRDFAGELLSQFDLQVKPVTHEQRIERGNRELGAF